MPEDLRLEMMLRMLAPLASIISIIGGPFLQSEHGEGMLFEPGHNPFASRRLPALPASGRSPLNL